MTKILLVEDDGQIASYLGELLRAEGFDTQIAGSKKEASAYLPQRCVHMGRGNHNRRYRDLDTAIP